MAKWILIAIAAIAVAVFGYYQYYVYVQTFRFRMTMTVSTPDGRKSASSVIAVSLPPSLGGGPVQGISRGTIYGVAPILDLGRYGTLIAALRSSSGDTDANRLSPTGNVEGRPIDWLIIAAYDIPPENVDASTAWRGGKRTLREQQYPQIVWIPPGVSDPRRVRALHPFSLPHVIGADVRITSITIEPTSDLLVERVPNAPNWLWRLRERYLPNRPTPLVYAGQYTLMLNHVQSQFPPKFHDR